MRPTVTRRSFHSLKNLGWSFRRAQSGEWQVPEGGFETTFTASVRKLYADGEGVEQDTEFDNLVDIGAFTKRPDYDALKPADVLFFEMRSLKSGQQSVVIVTAQKPLFVGIDPYSKFVDRKGDDNIIEVSES